VINETAKAFWLREKLDDPHGTLSTSMSDKSTPPTL
jgi:hypothetical protein